MKKAVSLLLAFAIIFSLCACSKDENKRKDLTMSVLQGAQSLLPYKAKTDTEKIISTNCFEGLYRFDSQSKLDLSGAVGVTVDKSNLIYVFKLNPLACWYMSEKAEKSVKSKFKNFKNKITATDYIFGIEQFIKSGNKQLNLIDGAEEFFNGEEDTISGIKAIDEFTLSFKLKKLDADFIYKLATLPIYPLNKSVFNFFGKSYGKTAHTTLFNGAYFVKEFSEDEAIIERNPAYKGNLQVKNSSVTIKTADSIAQMEKDFLKGKTDIYISPSLKRLPGDTTSFSETKSTWGLAFNCKTTVGSMGELRDILLASIDFNKIEYPYFSSGKALRIIPQNYTVGDSNYADFEPSELSYIKNLGNAQKNIDALILKTGTPSFTVKFFVPNEMEAAAKEIINDWYILFQEKIKVDLTLFKATDNLKISKECKYDLAILPLEAEDKTAFGVIDSIKGAPCYYQDKILNSLMTYIKATNNENASICKRAEKLIVDNGVFVPLFFDSNELYQASDIRGVYIANGGSSLYLHLGIKEEKNEKQ